MARKFLCAALLAAAPALAAAEGLGDIQRGLASFYASHLAGRPMADGTPLRLSSNSAAHPTLPFGTLARVTNLHNGRSAIVQIRDRGPHVRGRIVDVSPTIARLLGFERRGVAQVEVEAIGRVGPAENATGSDLGATATAAAPASPADDPGGLATRPEGATATPDTPTAPPPPDAPDPE